MTNADFIKKNLSDRCLSELFTDGTMFYRENFNSKVQEVFQKWIENNDKVRRNYEETYKDIIKNHSVYGAWNKVRNEKTGEWIKYSRTESIKFQMWLMLQYNKKDWE